MSQYPDLTVQRMTVGTLQAMLDNYVIKSTQTSRPSQTTVTNDPDLTFLVDANGVYDIEMYLLYGGQTAAGFKVAWSVPAGTSGNRRCEGPGSAASDTNADNIATRRGVHVTSSQITYSCVRNSASLQVHVTERALLTIGGAAGSVTLQWAQNASSATATVLAAGSYIKWRRVG